MFLKYSLSFIFVIGLTSFTYTANANDCKLGEPTQKRISCKGKSSGNAYIQFSCRNKITGNIVKELNYSISCKNGKAIPETTYGVGDRARKDCNCKNDGPPTNDPDMTAIWYLKQGYKEYRNGQYQKAISSFKECTSKSNNSYCNFALANIYTKLGRKTEAVNNYKKAVKINSFNELEYLSLPALPEPPKVTNVHGRGFIFRDGGLTTIPAKVGTLLKPGDIISLPEGSQITIRINNQDIIISETNKFQIPKELITPSKLPNNNLWEFLQKMLKYNEFDIRPGLSATAGVRG